VDQLQKAVCESLSEERNRYLDALSGWHRIFEYMRAESKSFFVERVFKSQNTGSVGAGVL